jgi:hypothetical protein
MIMSLRFIGLIFVYTVHTHDLYYLLYSKKEALFYHVGRLYGFHMNLKFRNFQKAQLNIDFI